MHPFDGKQSREVGQSFQEVHVGHDLKVDPNGSEDGQLLKVSRDADCEFNPMTTSAADV